MFTYIRGWNSYNSTTNTVTFQNKCVCVCVWYYFYYLQFLALIDSDKQTRDRKCVTKLREWHSPKDLTSLSRRSKQACHLHASYSSITSPQSSAANEYSKFDYNNYIFLKAALPAAICVLSYIECKVAAGGSMHSVAKSEQLCGVGAALTPSSLSYIAAGAEIREREVFSENFLDYCY